MTAYKQLLKRRNQELWHKVVQSEREIRTKSKLTKSKREYVKAIVHDYSLQRWTDQEIVQYLKTEKNIDLDRSTINRIRNQTQRKAEKWYIELRDSRYKYIAVYKERLDSLLRYQNKLNQIINFYMDIDQETGRPTQILYTDTVLKAISELHKIELSIFYIWKQLPTLNTDDIPLDIQLGFIQCSKCDRWFKDNLKMSVHECNLKMSAPIFVRIYILKSDGRKMCLSKLSRLS
jgi:hypothetical protein